MRKKNNLAENSVFVNAVQFLGNTNKNLLTVVASVEVTCRDMLVSLCVNSKQKNISSRNKMILDSLKKKGQCKHSCENENLWDI